MGYRVTTLLLGELGKKLEDYYSDKYIERIKASVEDTDKRTVRRVQELIETHVRWYEALDDTQKSEKKKSGEGKIPRLKATLENCRIVKCPSCANEAIVSGNAVEFSDPKIEDYELIVEVSILPRSFLCPPAILNYQIYREILIAGLGNSYHIKQAQDPLEYFDIDPKEHVDINELLAELNDDYGND